MAAQNGGLVNSPASFDETKDDECHCFDDEDTTSHSPTRRRRGFIPYGTIYEDQDDLRKHSYWIPGIPVYAVITHVERDMSGHLNVNPYVYTIHLEHGRYQWDVKKRYKDFAYLANRLMAHRVAERVRNPLRRTQRVMESAFNTIAGREHKPDCPERYGDDDTLKRRFEEEYNVVHKMRRCRDLPHISLEAANEGPIEKVATITLGRESMDSGPVLTGLSDEDGLPVDEDGRHYVPGFKDVSPPRFPRVPDAMITEGQIEDRKFKLESWLRSVLSIPVNRDYHETAEFLEVSRYSFINDLGGKYREGELKKRPGGGRVYVGLKQCCVRYFLPWGHRWLMIKDTYVAYINPHNETVRMVLLVDESFQVDPEDIKPTLKPREFVMANLQHVLHVKCKTEEETRPWREAIDHVLRTTGKTWLEPHRYGSTFPIRPNSKIKFFVDASDYWERAANMIELAREEIFIADWWLSPEIFLKRPMAEGNRWRLDMLLQRTAQRGVKIFILVYKEVEMALGLNSMHTKRALETLHPNIKVMRHPDHYVGTGTFLWAHHEKLIIIDQLIAFVGGVDLCYGRWDNRRHMLTDLGSVVVSNTQTTTDFNVQGGLASAVALASSSIQADSFKPDLNKKKPNTREVVQAFLDADGNLLQEEVIVVEKPAPPGKLKQRLSRAYKRNRRLQTPGATGDPAEATPIVIQVNENDDDLPTQKARVVNIHVVGPGGDTTDSAATTATATPSSSLPPFGPPPTPATMANATPSAANALKMWRHKPKRPSPSRSASPMDSGSGRFNLKKSGKEKISNLDGIGEKKPPEGTARVQVTVRNPNAPGGIGPTTPQPTVEGRNASLLKKITTAFKTNKTQQRWRYVLDHNDQTDEYVVNYYRNRETEVDLCGLEGAGKLFPGKDYINYIHKDFVDVADAFTDFTDRYKIPRMPWHDLHSVTYGDAARDVARHFIQRWNATKSEKKKDNDGYPYLLPKCYDYTSTRIPKIFLTKDTYNAEVQVVRSVSQWSTLIDKTESSIQQAYLSLIANSKHYVYIEDQFFVSMINSVEVTNEICKAICDRIIRAHKNNETFRVYVLIPLFPGFEGDLKQSQAYSSLLAVLHFTYLSISRGPHSLYECLKKAGVDDPSRYVSFNGIRTHDELCGKLVTEFIYVHCKLLIVDDLHTIIGSANINDRSQCGNRDSEVCLVITDKEFTPGVMNGVSAPSGKFAGSLRRQLMKEHLGLLEGVRYPAELPHSITVDDPISESFFVDTWLKIAKDNTGIYEDVFRVLPTNRVQSFDEMRDWNKQIPLAELNPKLAREQLRKIIGYLVEFPTDFLLKESIAPQLGTKEGLAPTALFV